MYKMKGQYLRLVKKERITVMWLKMSGPVKLYFENENKFYLT